MVAVVAVAAAVVTHLASHSPPTEKAAASRIDEEAKASRALAPSAGAAHPK